VHLLFLAIAICIIYLFFADTPDTVLSEIGINCLKACDDDAVVYNVTRSAVDELTLTRGLKKAYVRLRTPSETAKFRSVDDLLVTVLTVAVLEHHRRTPARYIDRKPVPANWRDPG